MFAHAFLKARNGFGSFGGGGFPSFNFGSKLGNGTSIHQNQADNANSTNDFINAVRFSAAKSIRTSTVILAIFNTIAAFATFAWILYYSYQNYKRLPCSRKMRQVDTSMATECDGNNISNSRNRKGLLSFVSSPDLFPLVVSGAITIQGVIFAVSQSKGLDGFSGSGCVLISKFMLPAVLLVPTTQFVLGCELLVRGVRTKPFQERGRWMMPICLAVIGLITLINFLVASFVKVEDKCFMSLFWFVSDYAVGILVVLVGYSSILLGIAVFLFVKLTRTSKVEATERVNGSRMIYFLALAVLSNAFMCPFFFVLGFMKTRWGEGPANALNLSMIAAVVASVSGLMTGGLHLFLRSSSISSIGPKDKWEEDERSSLKKKIRLRGFTSTNDYAYGSPSNSAGFGDFSKVEEARMASSPTFSVESPNPLRSNIFYPQVATAVQVPQPVQIGKGHVRKTSNYSLFPGKDGKPSMALLPSAALLLSTTLLPSTTYNPNISNNSSGNLQALPASGRSTPKPPPSVKSNPGRHRRDSSIASLATVQIGLRFSNVEDMPDINPKFLNDDGQVHHLNCPLAIKAAREKAEAKAKRPSPLSVTGDYESDEDTVCVRESEVPSDLPQRDPVKDARMKTLPPVPMLLQQQPLQDAEEETTLSPTVYTPQSATARAKLPSPRGVGFTAPPASRENTSHPSTPIEQGEGNEIKRSQWI